MKGINNVSLSAINKNDFVLVYFDVSNLQNISRIKKAYIIIEGDENIINCGEINFYLNDNLTSNDLTNISLSYNRNLEQNLSKRYKRYIDITEKFHLIASGVVENKGIYLSVNYENINNYSLQFKYIKNLIIPNSNLGVFYEEELMLSNYKTEINTPWFLIKNSHTISFYIKNLSNQEITVRLKNSPNTKDFIYDTQNVSISPNNTSLIIPSIFSKYIRLVANTVNAPVVIKVWFQTQLLK